MRGEVEQDRLWALLNRSSGAGNTGGVVQAEQVDYVRRLLGSKPSNAAWLLAAVRARFAWLPPCKQRLVAGIFRVCFANFEHRAFLSTLSELLGIGRVDERAKKLLLQVLLRLRCIDRAAEQRYNQGAVTTSIASAADEQQARMSETDCERGSEPKPSNQNTQTAPNIFEDAARQRICTWLEAPKSESLECITSDVVALLESRTPVAGLEPVGRALRQLSTHSQVLISCVGSLVQLCLDAQQDRCSDVGPSGAPPRVFIRAVVVQALLSCFLLPMLQTLVEPAPRVLMTVLETMAMHCPAETIQLLFSDEQVMHSMSAPTSEVLVRICAKCATSNAHVALAVFETSRSESTIESWSNFGGAPARRWLTAPSIVWTEHTVKVVETLLSMVAESARGERQEATQDVEPHEKLLTELARGMSLHALNVKSSLRFARLAMNMLSSIDASRCDDFRAALRTAMTQSGSFLAKRVLEKLQVPA
ncbi:hypothetical protein FVE85_5868 [Porphyridium purpureum]|uniref:Uncharacterized protein n=1 Tax=Porphyridium purpureum TaxID=35688 RepID=A0A5J4Z612_PORPP|nr:hypothetical protein FVE85_5868 [Porphyridium purpureum]|eukprot:POR8851..scf295_1